MLAVCSVNQLHYKRASYLYLRDRPRDSRSSGWHIDDHRMSCARCPCPDICLGWQPFCDAAAKEPQEPVEIRHICARSQGIKPTDYPSATVQARNLWTSLKGFVKSGGKLAPKPERSRRLAICLDCEKYDQAQKRCRVCGCRNSAKVWLASDSCPLDPPKWPALTDH